MTFVKAKMSFYHEKVGSRGMNESFEVKNEQLVSELEQAGFVQKVEGEELAQYQAQKSLEQKVGQVNALTNEAVSLAGHTHNQQAAQQQQNFAQARQQAGHAAVEQEIRRLENEGNTQKAEQLRSAMESQKQQVQANQAHKQNVTAEAQTEHQMQSRATAKKADK